MHTYLSARLTQLLAARSKWQGIHRELTERLRDAEQILVRLEGGIAEVQTALDHAPAESMLDDDLILH